VPAALVSITHSGAGLGEYMFMGNEDYPALYASADRASAISQARYLRFIKSYSWIMIFAAGLGVYGIKETNAAIAAAALIITSIIISILMVMRRDVDSWYRARAVAESVKTSTWRFMMRAEPYLDSDDITKTKSQFVKLIKAVLHEHKDLSHELGSQFSANDQVTVKMCHIRSLPLEERIQVYLHSRVDEQRDWYKSKSEHNKSQGLLWVSILIGCQAFAVLFVLLRIGYPDWGYWPVEVFVIGAGGSLTWIQVKRFKELASAYALTAHEVGMVKAELDQINAEKAFSQFVADSENAFSREHTQWLARKDIS